MAVYFIQAGDHGPIKIGCAFQPSKRLQTLQTANAEKLRILATIPGDADKEGELHERFARWRIHGEWFEPCDAILGFIGGICFCQSEYRSLRERVARDEELDEEEAYAEAERRLVEDVAEGIDPFDMYPGYNPRLDREFESMPFDACGTEASSPANGEQHG